MDGLEIDRHGKAVRCLRTITVGIKYRTMIIQRTTTFSTAVEKLNLTFVGALASKMAEDPFVPGIPPMAVVYSSITRADTQMRS